MLLGSAVRVRVTIALICVCCSVDFAAVTVGTHPDYPALKGKTKVEFSPLAAAIVRSAREGDPESCQALRTLLHGGRTKRLPLSHPQWVHTTNQDVEVAEGKLKASRFCGRSND